MQPRSVGSSSPGQQLADQAEQIRKLLVAGTG
jgi:hypothetical protein